MRSLCLNAKLCVSIVALFVGFVLFIVLFHLTAVSENLMNPESISTPHNSTSKKSYDLLVVHPYKQVNNRSDHKLAREGTPSIVQKEAKSFSCANLLSILTPYAANEYRRAHDSELNDGCQRPKLTFHVSQLLINATSYTGNGTIHIPTNPSRWNAYATSHNISKPKWFPGDETKAASYVGEALHMNDEVTHNTMLRLPKWSLWENVCATTWNGPLWWVLPSTTSNKTLNELNTELSACYESNPAGCAPHSPKCSSCQNPLIRTIMAGLSRRIKAKFVRSWGNLKKATAVPGTTLMFDFWLFPKAAAHIAHYTFKLGEAFELGLMSSISPIPDIHSVLFRDTWGYPRLKSTMSPWIQAFDAATWAVMPFNNYGSGKGKILSLSQDFPSKVVCFERLLWRPRYAEYFHTPIGSVAMQSLMLTMLNHPERPERWTRTPRRIPNITQIMEHTLDDALKKVQQVNEGKMCPPSTILVVHRGGAGNGRRAFYNRGEVIATIANVTGFPRTKIKEITMTSQISALKAVSAWSHAGLIVSPHGSQLVNVISSSPGSVVLEVAPAISRDFAYLTRKCGGTHIYSHGHKPFPMDASLRKAYDVCARSSATECPHRFNQRLKFIDAMKVNTSTLREDLKNAVQILAKQCESTSSVWAKFKT